MLYTANLNLQTFFLKNERILFTRCTLTIAGVDYDVTRFIISAGNLSRSLDYDTDKFM